MLDNAGRNALLQPVSWKMRLEIAAARFLEDETRNSERNANRNPEWWGDFSQLVKIEKIKFLGISRYKVELRF